MFSCRSFLLFLLMFILGGTLQAQFERTAGKIVVEDNPGGIVETWDIKKPEETEGSIFINESWNIGTVEFLNGRIIKNIPLKYNLKENYLHVRDDKGNIRVLGYENIKTFSWFDSDLKAEKRFVNLANYASSREVPLIGIAELIVEGEADLLILPRLQLQKSNYSVIHDMGQKNDEYIVVREQYLFNNDNFIKIKNKRSLLNALSDKENKLKQYIKDKRLRMKDTEDLADVVRYYDTL